MNKKVNAKQSFPYIVLFLVIAAVLIMVPKPGIEIPLTFISRYR